MLNRSASLAMSTCVLKALPCKLDIKRHSPSILYIHAMQSASVSLHIINIHEWTYYGGFTLSNNRQYKVYKQNNHVRKGFAFDFI